LQTRGTRAAEEKKAGEQQRNRASHGCEDDYDRPYRRGEISCRETRPTAVAVHDGRGGYRKEGSANYEGALRQPRHADARNIRGKQRADRRANRDADAADDLRRKEQSQRTALNGGHFHDQQ
jgi:hypothetical protein